MKLFIRIVDGQPFEHPIFEDNFKEAFPEIDIENLPSEFAKFERIVMPSIKVFEIAELTYGWDGEVVKDIWNVRQMTPEEHQQKTKILESEINASMEINKLFVQEKISQTNGDVQSTWINYLNELNAWVLTDVENPNFPNMPFVSINELGNIPNVIG